MPNKKKAKVFKLPYWVSNGGDGSANVCFCSTLANAEEKDSKQDEGWGESSAGTIDVKVEDNKLFFRISRYDENEKMFIEIWVEVKE